MLISRIILFSFAFFTLVSLTCDDHEIRYTGEKIKGITLVGPPSPFKNDPIDPIMQTNANWIAIVPYGYTRKGDSEVRTGSKWQWWGESYEGALRSVRLAHEKDMKVMLKPQVYIHNGWVGDMDFENEKEWLNWEKSYRNYILRYLEMAEDENVKMFCIGTEYKISVKKRESFWRSLIKEARSRYNGQLVYSANWDSYMNVPFWEDLDFIGISSYFPLTDTKTPDQKELIRAWRPITKKLNKFSRKKKKPVLFTEFGYLTVDGCANKAWLLEKKLHQLDENQKAQANAIDALFTNFWNESYWAGGFLWKWFPEMKGHEGYPSKDYTPQGKLSETIIQKWYQRQ